MLNDKIVAHITGNFDQVAYHRQENCLRVRILTLINEYVYIKLHLIVSFFEVTYHLRFNKNHGNTYI